jgi:lipopolysaccharide export system protein LptA
VGNPKNENKEKINRERPGRSYSKAPWLLAAAYILKTAGLILALFLSAKVFAAGAQPPVTIKADVITYDSATGVSTAEGNVVITREDGEAKAARAAYNLNTQEGRLEGGVTAVRGDAAFSADILFIRDEDRLSAEGSARVTLAGDSVAAPKVDYWMQRGFAKTSGGRGLLTRADGSLLRADSIEYDLKRGVGEAKGGVEISAPARGITGAGDKAVYTPGTDGEPGEITLSGNAWLIQDGNKIMGDVLIARIGRETFEGKGRARLDLAEKANGRPDGEPKAATSAAGGV